MKPCKHITYTGSSLELAEATLLETSNTQAIFQMIIHDIRRVQKERLYYDTFDMIGAIGGSLGLFLGFSFFDGICKCMDKLTDLIKYLSGRELEVNEPGCEIRKVSFEFVKQWVAKSPIKLFTFSDTPGPHIMQFLGLEKSRINWISH